MSKKRLANSKVVATQQYHIIETIENKYLKPSYKYDQSLVQDEIFFFFNNFSDRM